MKFSSLAIEALAAIAITVGVASGEEEASSAQTVVETAEEEQCGLYLAISSTSTVDETKWGMYAGKDFDEGVEVGYPDVAINNFNLQANAGLYDLAEDEFTPLSETINFFEQFIWVPIPAGGEFEMVEGRAVSAIPGAGVLGGYNPSLTNTDWNHTSAFVRDALNEERGVSHPGRGAYSNFFNVALRSTKRIPAGREIFMDYGDNWEEEHKDEQLDQEDYDKVDETVDKMVKFFNKYEDQLDASGKRQIYDFLIRDVMNAAAGEAKGRKIAEILPTNPELLEQVQEQGGAYAFSQPHSQRDPKWLQEHGRCMDNIRPGPSTIPHAGRGAFAARNIKEGGLVSPVPLIHLPVESIVDMYDIRVEHGNAEEESYIRASDEVTGQQLMLNYCYGHPESSMLFFPAGAISALINHDSKAPNAKMLWSKHPGHQKHWLSLEPQQLLEPENLYMGLIMEIVATRDIQEGEEIFIDYGDQWEQAWKEHQDEWSQHVQEGNIPSEWPVRAIDLNKEYRSRHGDDIVKFKTPAELREQPYPENVMLKCFATAQEQDNDYMQDGLFVRSWQQPDHSWVFDGSDDLFDCQVISRRRIKSNDETPDNYVYTAKRILDGEVDIIVKDIPHEAFVFVDKPGTGDQFTDYAFRHYIQIPDEIFPQGPWRDLTEEE